MNKIPRWLIVSVGLLLVLPLAGAAVLKAVFPPERLREIAVPQLESRLGRDVSLRSVKLKVFPYIAIRLQDVAVSNPPGFSDSPTIQLDALDLRLELLPLFRKQFELSQVRLIGPILRYEVAADGTNNIAGILHADSDAEVADRPGSGARFDIKDLIVANGGILYRDAQSGRALRVQVEGKLNLTPGDRAGGTMASDGRFEFSNGLMVVQGRDTTRIPDADVGIRALFDPSDGRLAIPRLHLQVAGLTLEGSGASQVENELRSIRLDLASSEFQIADLLAQLPTRDEPAAATADGLVAFRSRLRRSTAMWPVKSILLSSRKRAVTSRFLYRARRLSTSIFVARSARRIDGTSPAQSAFRTCRTRASDFRPLPKSLMPRSGCLAAECEPMVCSSASVTATLPSAFRVRSS